MTINPFYLYCRYGPHVTKAVTWHIGFKLVILVLVIMSAYIAHARAHSWYEAACCNEAHCHPVTDGVVDDGEPDGVHVQGFGILSYSDARLRWSRDNGDHLCVSSGKLLCVYRRPKGM